MTDPNLNLGVGGGAPPLGGPSLEDDEKALKKGNAGVLVLAAVAAVALLVGVLAVVLTSDDGAEYGAIGRQLNQMKSENFDRFFTCALPETRLRDLETNRDLSYAIHETARTRPVAYAAHVRQDCMVHLNEHGPRLHSLIAPTEMQPDLDALDTALEALRTSWMAFLSHLDSFEENYDEADYAEEIEAITRAWFDYKTAHGRLNDHIREMLDR